MSVSWCQCLYARIADLGQLLGNEETGQDSGVALQIDSSGNPIGCVLQLASGGAALHWAALV